MTPPAKRPDQRAVVHTSTHDTEYWYEDDGKGGWAVNPARTRVLGASPAIDPTVLHLTTPVTVVMPDALSAPADGPSLAQICGGIQIGRLQDNPPTMPPPSSG